MSKVYLIRPYLYYQSGAKDGVTPEQALSCMRKGVWATVSSRADAIKVLLLMGWNEEDIAFTMNYALHGGSSPSMVII